MTEADLMQTKAELLRPGIKIEEFIERVGWQTAMADVFLKDPADLTAEDRARIIARYRYFMVRLKPYCSTAYDAETGKPYDPKTRTAKPKPKRVRRKKVDPCQIDIEDDLIAKEKEEG
jgi:hypothetical protein